MSRQHHYQLQVTWTGNKGTGTDHYTHYERSHTIEVKNKVPIFASSDTPFLGDATKHNPEDLLLASLSTCHMLWYLHLCADAGVIVVAYVDNPTGVLEQNDNGGGKFSAISLFPKVTLLSEKMIPLALSLHHEANKKCFIANSVNIKVQHYPTCVVHNS